MTNTLFLIFELAGTVAFAVSGAMTALKRSMDIFGVAILGLTTAVGGGIIRDLVLGNTPPVAFRLPIYALTAIGTAIVFFLPRVRRAMQTRQAVFNRVLFLMDSLGLSIFTVVGIQVAMSASEHNLFFLVFVGVVTGVGGGVLRDVLAGKMPVVFKTDFYACASLIGALVCSILWPYAGGVPAMTLGAGVILVLRLCAARYHWSLPKA